MASASHPALVFKVLGLLTVVTMFGATGSIWTWSPSHLEEVATAHAKKWNLLRKGNDIWSLPPFVVGPYYDASNLERKGNDKCSLPPFQNGVGCRGSFEMWSFDKSSKTCDKFMFGGCGGNENQFPKKEECEKECL